MTKIVRLPLLDSARRVAFPSLALMGMMLSTRVAAVAPGQVDDFQAGTAGWTAGAPHPQPPSLLNDAGPGGIGDSVLRIVALGGGGAGSRLAAYNRTQWAGDYQGTGVNALTVLLSNPGSAALDVRVGVSGAGSQWVSLSPFALPADGAWHEVRFGLDTAELTRLSGSATLVSSLQAVSEVRILHNPAPAWQGAVTASTLLVGSVQAVPEPSRALLLLLGTGVLLSCRRR